MSDPAAEHKALIDELERRLLGVAARHQRHGEGVVTRTATSLGGPWVEVDFQGRKLLFSAPFTELRLEARP